LPSNDLKGTWCSGITSAPHAEGPGFKSQCVHSFQFEPSACVRAAGDLAPPAASLLPPFCRLLPLFSGLRLLDLRTSIMLKSVALRGFCSLCVKGGFSLLFLFAALCFPVCASPAPVPGIPLRSASLPLRCFSSGKCSPAFACPPHCANACAGRLISFISVRVASRERKNSRAPLPRFYTYMLGQLMRARPDDLPRLGSGANSQTHCG
jgi:hypothetical protein